MSGRNQVEIGTHGDITTVTTVAGTVRAEARQRDWDDGDRKVTATGPNERAAKQGLRK